MPVFLPENAWEEIETWVLRGVNLLRLAFQARTAKWPRSKALE